MSEHTNKTEVVSIESLYLDIDQSGKNFTKLNIFTKEYGKITCKTVKKVEEDRVINGIKAKKTEIVNLSVTSELPTVIPKIQELLNKEPFVRVKITFTEWDKKDEDKLIRYIKPFEKINEWEILSVKEGSK
jgi:hypothetical protein